MQNKVSRQMATKRANWGAVIVTQGKSDPPGDTSPSPASLSSDANSVGTMSVHKRPLNPLALQLKMVKMRKGMRTIGKRKNCFAAAARIFRLVRTTPSHKGPNRHEVGTSLIIHFANLVIQNVQLFR